MNKKDYKKIRDKLNLTQQEFADLLGTGLRTIVRWESGGSKPGPKKRQNLSLLLDGIANKKQLNYLRHVVKNAADEKTLKSVLNIAIKGIGAIAAIGTIGGLGKYLMDYFIDRDKTEE